MAAADQKPTADQQKQTLKSAAEIAVHYANQRPDFLCAENVARTDRLTTTNMSTDRLSIELSYFGQKERYKLAAIDGRKTTQAFESLDGLINGGEFGSLQLGVFDASSGADFQWKAAAMVLKRPATVYTYRIARAKSHYLLGGRMANGTTSSAAAGYHGKVYLDSETSRVLRLTEVSDDIPKDSGILQSSVEVDYDFKDIGGKSYLLPSRSESHMERGYRQIGNVVTFTDYKKFAADATIDFH